MRSIKKNVIVSLVGTISLAFAQWMVVIFLAKFGGPSDVGIYAYTLALISPVFAFSNMNLRSIQATDVANQYQFEDYLSFRICTSLSALFFIFLLLIFIGETLTSTILVFAVIFSFSKLSESLSELHYGLFQKNELMGLISLSLVMRGCVMLLAYGGVYLLSRDILYSGLTCVAGWALVNIFYENDRRKKIVEEVDIIWSKHNFRIAKLALPLAITVFVNVLIPNIPRYFIESKFGIEELGVYAAISYFIVAGATVVNAIGQTITPRLAVYSKENQKEFIKLFLKSIVLTALISLIGIMVSNYFGSLILSIFYSDQFANFEKLFFLTMVGGAIMYMSTIVGCTLTALRLFKIQSVLSGLQLIFLVPVSWILIENYGLSGAACSVIFVFSIKFILLSAVLVWALYRYKIGRL